MQRIEIVNVCDICGKEDDQEAVEVATHLLMVDQLPPVEVEVCGRCWPGETLEKLVAAGRTPKPKQRKSKKR